MESTKEMSNQEMITTLRRKIVEMEKSIAVTKTMLLLSKSLLESLENDIDEEDSKKEPCDNIVVDGHADNPELQPGAKATEPSHVWAEVKEE